MTTTYSVKCHDFIFEKLLKKWSKFGINSTYGYSEESLTKEWKPNPVGRIRLLTQCRQLYTFSHAYQLTKNTQWLSLLTPLYNFILKHYLIEEQDSDNDKAIQRWRFSLDDELQPQDNSTDAYALAFILLSFSFYYKATGDKSALIHIKGVDSFLNRYMSAKNGGFYEAYPIDIHTQRRQNPHMHLLEGYIAAFNTTQDIQYKEQVIKILQLFKTRFYDDKHHSLLEFFDSNWNPDQQIGHHIEPGHHFEWVWLLHQAYKIQPDPSYLDIAKALWEKACAYGFDPQGGIYNQIDAFSGTAIDKEKRIWPITEYLKAACVQADNPTEAVNKALEFAFDYYLLEDGGWNEYLDSNNKPKIYPLPGTTSYHIFLGLAEVLHNSTGANE